MAGTITQAPGGATPTTVPVPSINVYDRLEPRPRTSKDFERSLRAEVRDPLWMLTRQWQFGEFKGEDTGSAFFAKMEIESGEINGFKSREQQNYQSYSSDFPLEPLIEGIDVPMDLSMRIQIGHFWHKLLDKNGLGSYKPLFVNKYNLGDPNQEPDAAKKVLLQSNPELLNLLNASFRWATDGGALLNYLKDNATNKASDGINPIQPADKTQIDTLGTELMNWFSSLYQQSSIQQSAWDPERLEYRFSIKIEASVSSDNTFNAPEYSDGKLDWFSFDKADGTSSGSHPSFASKTTSVIMSELNFPGMPNSRFWQFEDAYVDLGNLDARTTDLAKMVMTEFALVYGNDWCLIPMELKVGTHTKIKSMIVKDVFGQRTLIEAAGKGVDDGWQRWRMYNLNTAGNTPGQQADNGVFVPPVIMDLLESEPIEKVSFIRDEMANMVWAIEKIVPNELGGGMNGTEAALRYRTQFEIYKPGSVTAQGASRLENIGIEYNLMTSVPENWIPMVPVAVNTDPNKPVVKLQRGAMPRFIKGYKPSAVRPRTKLMTEVASPFLVNEEELTRSGVVVSSNYQRVRWNDGRVIVWLGRKKEVGRGEGSSGLQFDQIRDKTNT